MATTETTETTETLRAAIEAAMRRRDPGVRVSVTPAAGQTLASVDGPSSALVWGSSKADTIALAGNSVCPDVARAIVGVNLHERWEAA